MNGSHIHAVCLVVALSGGCLSASPPALPPLDAGFEAPDAGNAGWADTIVAIVSGGVPVSCTANLPACGTAAPGCGAEALLGPADGQTFPLSPGASVVVAFRCAAILDRGGATGADFTVWASVPTGDSGVVEVSPDGETFASVGTLSPSAQSDQSFSIASTGASVETFVRVTNVGPSDLLLDAVEAR